MWKRQHAYPFPGRATIRGIEKKNNDTNGAAENDIWCPGALRVVIKDGTGEGAPRDRSINWGLLKRKFNQWGVVVVSPTVSQLKFTDIDRADRAAP
jgi:hypothetical protein